MRYHLASYERDVIRPHVFGKFRDLLGAVAHSPAMLIYLDNQLSQADTSRVTLASYGMQQGNGRAGQAGIGGRIGTRLVVRGRGGVLGFPRPLPQRGRATGLNENYARELLELHTLGVDGGYTQHDVTEVARALTGWSVLPPQLAQNAANIQRTGATVEGEFVFRPAVHDAESKVVLGVKLKAGRGMEDGEQVLDIVAHHPSTAKFIATKLVRRFVSDTPPADLVKRAAETFRKTDGDLREVVRTIVTSPEFFSSAAYRAKVKTPFEVVVSALRAVGAPADLTPRTAQLIGSLGEPVFGRQTPDGWPETGDQWVNTGAILNRINFGIALAAGRVPGTSRASWPLPAGIDNASRDTQVDAVVVAFLGGEVSPETRAVLKEGNNPLLAGTAPDSSAMQGERAFRRLPSLEGVPQIVGLALGSPEFQRR